MNAPARIPTTRTPNLVDEMLSRLGVMQRAPSSWSDSPRLDPMPLGPVPIAAPPPVRPEGVRGPWPQAPVIDPEFYAPVLSVPLEDRADHVRHIVSRYLRQLVTDSPGAASRALHGKRLVTTSDAEFARVLTETSLGQFVRLAKSDELSARLRAHVVGAIETYATLDFSFAPTDELLPDLRTASVVALARRDGARWTVPAIDVDGRVVTPSEGHAWTLAKWYALQGAQLRLVTSTHPRLHFPADVINAVTRSCLPSHHPIYRLIKPHTRFTLGLHEAVIHHRRSTIHNSQREIYNMFPYTTEGMHRMVASGRNGIEGNPAWPAWRFGDEFTGTHVSYGRYRRAWLDAWTSFASEMLSTVSRDDVAVRVWADHIAGWLPGFPDGRAVMREGELARAVALYLCTVSTFHTADHHSYAAIPIEQMPWRLRTRMPATGEVSALDGDAEVTVEDAFRQRMGHAMFFKPAVITSLRDVAYDLADTRERRCVRQWSRSMDDLDSAWESTGFPCAHEIASGVHY